MLRSGIGKAIRERAGLTLPELGASLEPPVPASTIARWEGGDRRPRMDSARAYLAALERIREATASVEEVSA